MQENNNENGERQTSTVRITRRIELNFWRTCLLNAGGLALAWLTTSSIQFNNIVSFALLVVMIWFLNWILKPILVLFALPFIIFTVGHRHAFINALIIYFSREADSWRRHCRGLLLGRRYGRPLLVSVLSWGLAPRQKRTHRSAHFYENKK